VAKDTPEEEIKIGKTFSAFMTENSGLNTMIQKGKGKLKWERDMPKEIEEKLEVCRHTALHCTALHCPHTVLNSPAGWPAFVPWRQLD
jgi:hypothetical protein